MISGALLLCLGLQAQTLQQKVDQAVKAEPLKGAVVGVMVQDVAGHVLASREPGRRMVPASNLKLVTTGTALHALGPDFRFETGIGYTGTVEDGTLHGDVYIIGGGDPTIGVVDTVAVKPDALFWRWKSMLKDAGISRIDGRIIGDGRAYEGHLENTTWGYDDTGTYYGAGCNALSFYENAIDYLVSAGAEGEPVKVTQRHPDTPWIHFSNRTMTAPKGTGNSLYLYTTDLAPFAELRGTYSIDRKPKVEHFANKYGALTCAATRAGTSPAAMPTSTAAATSGARTSSPRTRPARRRYSASPPHPSFPGSSGRRTSSATTSMRRPSSARWAKRLPVSPSTTAAA